MNRRQFVKTLGVCALAATTGTASLSSAEAATRRTPVICVEACLNINIRANASVRSRKLGTLYTGEQANVLAISHDLNWWCIQHGRGTAWVSADPALTKPVAWRR
jgi:uncharacterized protein YgiM (DUF1202 family)